MKRWTRKEDEKVIKMAPLRCPLPCNMSYKKIAEKLGRTESSIRHRVNDVLSKYDSLDQIYNPSVRAERKKQQEEARVKKEKHDKILKKVKPLKARWLEVGSCRGYNFQSSGEIDLNRKIKEIELASEEEVEWLIEDFYNLFYNIRRREVIKEQVLKVLRAAKKRKLVFECWEEGTTGLSVKLSKNELTTTIITADHAWMTGHKDGNISDILK